MNILESLEKSGFNKKPKRKITKKEKEFEDPDIDDGLTDLRQRSMQARLREPILKNEKLHYVNEQQRLNLLKESGKVMETSFGEFLYFGYMEKMNIDILMMLKKLKPKIDNLVKEMDTDGVIKEIKKEFRTVMQTIKKSQEKDIKEWKKEH